MIAMMQGSEVQEATVPRSTAMRDTVPGSAVKKDGGAKGQEK